MCILGDEIYLSSQGVAMTAPQPNVLEDAGNDVLETPGNANKKTRCKICKLLMKGVAKLVKDKHSKVNTFRT